jgi:hypothetical protein
MTLGFAFPGEWVNALLAERGPSTYRIETIGYDSSRTGSRMKDAGFYPVGIDSERYSTFAIKLDGRDRRIYELNEDWYLDGAETKDTPWVEFPSYAVMLAQIVGIRREDGTIIRRSDAEVGRAAGGKPRSPAKSARARGASGAAKKRRRGKR